MLKLPARGCPATTPAIFSPGAHSAACYSLTITSQPFWTPWRIAVAAVTLTIVAVILAAHIRGRDAVVRVILGAVCAWGAALAIVGLPWDHVYRLSPGAVIAAAVVSATGATFLYMTREARSCTR